MEYIERLREYKKLNKKTITKGEKRFLDNYLQDSGLKRIKRQNILGGRIADFCITRCGIRIEIDGKHHHTRGYKAYDKKRDRIIFERYGWITLRINDFDDNKAKSVIDYCHGCKFNNMQRLQFIKDNIRDKDIKTINEDCFIGEEREIILYYKSLYNINNKKNNTTKPEKKTTKTIEKKITKKIEKKIIKIDRDHFSSMGVNMLYQNMKINT